MTVREEYTPGAQEAQDDELQIKDNGGMRTGGERRQTTEAAEGTDRRTGRDRRRGFDRRSGIDRRRATDRRSRRLFRDGEVVERRAALRRLSDDE
jgi:hypothetical protein